MSSQTPERDLGQPDRQNRQSPQQKSSSATPASSQVEQNMEGFPSDYDWGHFPSENTWMTYPDETLNPSAMYNAAPVIGQSQSGTTFDIRGSLNDLSVTYPGSFDTIYPFSTEQSSNTFQVNPSFSQYDTSGYSNFPIVSASLPPSSLPTELPLPFLQPPYPVPAYQSLSSASMSPARSIDTEDDLSELAGSSTQQESREYRCWDHGCNGRTFSSASNFRRHRQEQAGLRRKWRCPHCGREFTRSTARNNHTKEGNCQQRRQSIQPSPPHRNPRRQSQ